MLCYNVNGISANDKCDKILQRFVYPYKDKGPEVIGFQELKLNLENGKRLVSKLSAYSNFLSLDPGKVAAKCAPKGGVLISLHKSLNAHVLNKKVDPGWLIMVKVKIQEKVMVIVNAYFPPQATVELYKTRLQIIDNYLKQLKCDNVVFMGDFNTTLTDLDCGNSWGFTHKASMKVLTGFLNQWDLQDIWRIQHPHTEYYTHRQICRGKNLPCRLDYIFTSLNFSPYVSNSAIGVSYCSDHSPLNINVEFNEPGGRKPFIFPVDLCYSDQFRNDLKRNLEIIKSDNKEANPHILWDLIKSTIRSTTLRFKSLQSKIRKELVEELESKIARETLKMDKELSFLIKKSHSDIIAKYNKDLDNLFSEGKALNYARNLAKWYSQKGKPTAYFLNKFKIDKDRPVISSLITNAGTVSQNPEILKEVHSFYSELYQKKEISLPVQQDKVHMLTSDQYRIMLEDFTMVELYAALKTMKSTSAPGNDGLTMKFYLHFWDLVGVDLFNSLEFSFEQGKLSNSQRQGIIKLLPKKLRNLLLVSNWRPIILLNVDYKILAKVFAVRLKDILPDLIHPDQRGFVQGRRISHSILDVYAVADILMNSEDDLDFLMCSVDIRKAFDSIDWDFLRYALSLYDFPPEFLKWFDVIYCERIAYVSNNNFLSDPIKIEKGNFQGCPLSPLFFVLAIELLASRIRNNKNIEGFQFENLEKKINLVADDILLIFKNNYQSYTEIDKELTEFSKNSGLTINREKCTISHINKAMSPVNDNVLPLFKRKLEDFDYIGLNVPFNFRDTWAKNITPRLDRMFMEISLCSEMGPNPVLGKVCVLKSLFFSRLPYFLELVTLPEGKERVLADVQTKLNNIVWNGKKPKMKLCNAVMPTNQGGLGMIDIQKRYSAIKIELLQRALDVWHVELWQAHLFSFFTAPFELVVRSNLSNNGLKHFFVKPLTPFWQEVLSLWVKFHYVSGSSEGTPEEFKEFVSRPMAFNSAFGVCLGDKRYVQELKDYFDEFRWFSVFDAISLSHTVFPQKGFITRYLAKVLIQNIPLKWKKIVIDQNMYTIAQKLVDQKFSMKQLYALLISKFCDFETICSKWEGKDGIVVNWEKLTPKIKHIINGTLRSFFIMFNSRSLVLNSVACHFAPVSEYCTLCKKSKETFIHVFWECPKITKVWSYVHLLTLLKYRSKDLSMFPINVPNKLVFLFTLCKYYIYICRCTNNVPTVFHFKKKLLFHLEALRVTLLMKLKEEEFEKEWGDVYLKLKL